MPSPPTGNPVGRTPSDIDWNQVDKLLIAGCPGTEIAGYFGIAADTFYNRCVKDHGVNFTQYSQSKNYKGNAMIRLAQFNRAINNNSEKMLMYLGRVRLKQTELIEEAQEELNDLRQAILEMSQAVPGIGDALRQKLENAPSLQNQGCSRQVHNVSTELGADGADSGSSSVPDYIES